MTVGERDASDSDGRPERDGRAPDAPHDAATAATLGALSEAWHGGAPADAATNGASAAPGPTAAGPDIDPHEPRLGSGAPAAPVAADVTATRGAPSAAAANVYRSRDDRNRSVYRRANPWYRRLARGLIATFLFGAAAIGIYVGARYVQDWLDRDQIPAAGADVPAIGSTSILITSTAPTVPLQGTLTFDVGSGAYEFVGLAGSPNATDNLTSPDGVEVFARTGDGAWAPVEATDPLRQTVDRAIAYLRDDASADAVLTNRLRRGYIELVDQVDEGDENDGAAATPRTRYELSLDLGTFAEAFPLQWQDFQATAVPGADDVDDHPVTLWLDDDDVLVGVDDPATGWSWQRLTHSTQPFSALAPGADQVVDPVTSARISEVRCTVTGVTFTTALATCDAALDAGRTFTVQVGLADDTGSPAAELAVATVCGNLQGDEPRRYDNDAFLTLAGLLVDAGVCPGDTVLVQLEN